MIFEQIAVGGDNNFSYLIADEVSKEAAVVDPSNSPKLVLKIAKQHDLTIKYLIITHNHPDHTNGNSHILKHTEAKLVGADLGENSLQVSDGDVLTLGKLELKIIATPGHTPDSICILVENKLITGDTLFVGFTGRTWSKEGAIQEHKSIHNKLLTLDDDIEVYPGHDYGEKPSSTIGYEREHNPFL